MVCVCATPGNPPTAAPEYTLQLGVYICERNRQINYCQQENRAQYVATRTNVLVYIARYNIEVSVFKKNFFPFYHLNILVCA